MGLDSDSSRSATNNDSQLSEEQISELTHELQEILSEIDTLKQVLNAKYQRKNEIRTQLGMNPMAELQKDFNTGLATIKSSVPYQKTADAVNVAKEKTVEKWNLLKQTDAYKNMENKIGSAYSTLFSKLTGSSSSNQPTTSSSSTSEPEGTVHWQRDPTTGSSEVKFTINPPATSRPGGGAVVQDSKPLQPTAPPALSNDNYSNDTDEDDFHDLGRSLEDDDDDKPVRKIKEQ